VIGVPHATLTKQISDYAANALNEKRSSLVLQGFVRSVLSLASQVYR